MADGSFNVREIEIDLVTPTTARVIRAANTTSPTIVHIKHVIISGTSGATNGIIVLRKESASGPRVLTVTPGVSGIISSHFHLDTEGNGLYMDAQTTAWLAGSMMIIYLA